MTKEITKARLLQEIQDKFKLREFEPEPFTFSERVCPIYDLGPHLGIWETLSSTVSITSAAAFLFYTVPETEEWTLRAYQLVYGMTGAHKGSGLYIAKRPIAGSFIYLDLKKGQDVSYLVNLAAPVRIHSGSQLKYLIDDYTSTQDLTVIIDVLKEEIR